MILFIGVLNLNPELISGADLSFENTDNIPTDNNSTLKADLLSESQFLRSLRYQVKSDHTLAPIPFSLFLFEDFATDTDQDGVNDIDDIDDDNDGILDTDEGCTDIFVSAANATSATEIVGRTRNLANSIDGVNGTTGDLRDNGSQIEFLLRGGAIVKAGTQVTINAKESDDRNDNQIIVTESTNGTTYVNSQTYGFAQGEALQAKVYTLTTDATHIRVTYDRDRGDIDIDNVSFAAFVIPCTPIDTDSDGISDHLDIDSDGDGIVDLIESQATTGTPIVPTGTDTDGDGLDNAFDTDNGGTAISPIDTDDDGTPDYLDFNSDDDGFTDLLEGWDTDGNLTANTTPSGSDSDGDGLDNAFDLVSGRNSTTNVYNNQDALDFPDVTTSGETSERDWREINVLDSDADGIPDTTDIDDDNDGILDSVEGTSTDTDGDGKFNSVDIDSDNDGIPDILEAGGVDSDNDGRVDNNTDTDTDGLANVFDTDNGGTALVNGDQDDDGFKNFLDIDSDNDGITDIIEAGGTDSNNNGRVDSSSDLDEDGWADTFDSNNGGTALSILDTDSDGLKNYLDIDSDGDGIVDLIESQTTTGTPLKPGGTDTDNDGLDNTFDSDNGGTPITLVDTDSDSTPDYLDLNSDNDSFSDAQEGYDTDGDLVANTTAAGADTDGDGLDNAFDLVNGINSTTNVSNDQDALDFPNQTTSGNTSERDWREVNPLDTDYDGIADSNDIDDDNDGILDTEEGFVACVTGGTISAVSTDLVIGSGVTTTLFDGVTNAQNFYFREAPQTFTVERDIFKVTFNQNIALSEVRIVIGFDVGTNGFIDAGVEYEWQASNDNTNWTTISGTNATQAQLALTGAEANASPAESEIFDLSANTTQYQYYRLRWLSGGQILWDAWIEEITFTEGPCTAVTKDTDSDGIADHLDIDSDGDGIVDLIEAQATTGTPIVPVGTDTDGDGLDNAFDTDNGGTSISPVDTENDGTDDYIDTNSDLDGFGDLIEGWDTNGDFTADTSPAGTDSDGDGLDDAFDLVAIKNNTTNVYNNQDALDFPNVDDSGTIERDWRENNSQDADGDGIVNLFDLDDDNDGILDTSEGCVDFESSASGAIVNSGGVLSGDFSLINDSNLTADNGVRLDGASDYIIVDLGRSVPSNVIIKFTLWKSDNNGKTLRFAQLSSSTPDLGGGANSSTIDDTAIATGGAVTDYNFTLNAATRYIQIEMTSFSSGRIEVIEATLPAYSECSLDTDQDGITNNFDVDSDNDGIPDIIESGGVDTNGDGRVDNITDTDNDGYANTFDSDNGGTALIISDLDGDGLSNQTDIDSDGDGIVDLIESQATTGTPIVPTGTDTDEDGLDNAFDTNSGGTSVTPVDTDSDGNPDYLDTNSDADSSSDLLEGWDTDGDFIPNTTPAGADTDSDGLDNAFDLVSGINSTTNVYNNQDALDFPDQTTSGNTSERDWREVNILDNDLDGVSDFDDIDDDNDGILDTQEGYVACLTGGTISAVSTDLVIGSGSTATLFDGVTNAQNFYFREAPQAFTVERDIFKVTFNQKIALSEIRIVIGFDVGTNGFIDAGVEYEWQASNDNTTWTTISGTNATQAQQALTGAEQNASPAESEIFDLSSNITPYQYYRLRWLSGGQIVWDAWIEEITFTEGPCIGTAPDTDSDGIADHLDIDSDGDGIVDLIESQATTGTPVVPGGTDTDGDGLDNAFDTDNGGTATSIADTESDGTDDYKDFNSDGDGLSDLLEGWDTNGDFTADTSPAGTDSDGDGLDDAFDLVAIKNSTTNVYNNQDANDFPNVTTSGLTTERDWREANPLDTDLDNIPDASDLDDDNDGVLDSDEGTSTDTDGDGFFNSVDLDSDNDGIPDIIESGGIDSNNDGRVDDNTDTDNDGLADTFDIDNGGTALADADTDSDGFKNRLDLDSDNDGIEDIIEAGGIDSDDDGVVDDSSDLDEDGWANTFDSDNGGTALSVLDTDSDGIRNFLDIDSDGDGIVDLIESQSTTGTPVVPGGSDTDSDGIDNAFDSDNGGSPVTPVATEGDGVPDYLDTNSDGDSFLDVLEAWDTDGDLTANTSPAGSDLDGDGLDNAFDLVSGPNSTTNVYNNQDALDFPNVTTSGETTERDWREVNQLDSDLDGVADITDVDDDNDGILDTDEGCTNVEVTGNSAFSASEIVGTVTNPANGVDGVNGSFTSLENNGAQMEVILRSGSLAVPQGTQITVLAQESDDRNNNRITITESSDGISFVNSVEYSFTDGEAYQNKVYTLSTNATHIRITYIRERGDMHIDNVSYPTFFELCDGVDTDNDGVSDHLDLDSDGDGIPDIIEAGGVDSDNNGLIDSSTDTDGDGWSNVVDSNNGGSALLDLDLDSDGYKNRVDIDSDGDGIVDLIEAQATTDTPIIPSGTDTDGDGIDNAFDTDNSGTWVTPVDTDSDSTPDYLDLNSDGDGLTDLVEAWDTDQDYIGNTTPSSSDSDADGLDNAFDNISGINSTTNIYNNQDALDFPDISTSSDTSERDWRESNDNDCEPGGIESDLLYWIRADEGGTSWRDISNNYKVTTAVGTPSSGSFVNFNPSVFLDGTEYYNTDLNINANTLQDLTVIAIYRPSVDNSGSVWGEENGGFDRFILDGNGVGENNAVSNGTATENNITNLYQSLTTTMSSVTFDEDVSNGSSVSINGGKVLSFTSNHAVETSNNLQIGAIGNGTNQFDGAISEVLVYNNLLTTSTTLQQIHSYLALKYGITLSSDTDGDASSFEAGEGDYIASDGTTIFWDASENQTYHNNVAGIVRDDLSCLLQKQSKSENVGSIVTIGLDSDNDGLEVSNDLNPSTFSGDKAALLWGHDGEALYDNDENIDIDGSQVESRLNREWRVRETGTIGTVTVEFDVSELLGVTGTGTNDESQMVLLVDEDGDFSAGATEISQSFAVADDGVVSFRVDFSDGNYFTLASGEQNALPITLLSFTGQARSGHIELNWTTASEVGNSQFRIERSVNGQEFQGLSSLEGAGTTESVNRYVFKDQRPLLGRNYYRLVDIDIQGNENRSEVIKVNYANQSVTPQPYPNPLKTDQDLKIDIPYDSEVGNIRLMNMQGKSVTFESELSANSIVIKPQNITQGMYILNIIINGYDFKYKLMIVN